MQAADPETEVGGKDIEQAKSGEHIASSVCPGEGKLVDNNKRSERKPAPYREQQVLEAPDAAAGNQRLQGCLLYTSDAADE